MKPPMNADDVCDHHRTLIGLALWVSALLILIAPWWQALLAFSTVLTMAGVALVQPPEATKDE